MNLQKQIVIKLFVFSTVKNRIARRKKKLAKIIIGIKIN